MTLAHLDAVHALARRLVREQAEDLVQETCSRRTPPGTARRLAIRVPGW